jgi:hypothetical protein
MALGVVGLLSDHVLVHVVMELKQVSLVLKPNIIDRIL